MADFSRFFNSGFWTLQIRWNRTPLMYWKAEQANSNWLSASAQTKSARQIRISLGGDIQRYATRFSRYDRHRRILLRSATVRSLSATWCMLRWDGENCVSSGKFSLRCDSGSALLLIKILQQTVRQMLCWTQPAKYARLSGQKRIISKVAGLKNSVPHSFLKSLIGSDEQSGHSDKLPKFSSVHDSFFSTLSTCMVCEIPCKLSISSMQQRYTQITRLVAGDDPWARSAQSS